MTQPSFKDLTGQKFGKLTVISRCENDKYGRAQWLCKCTCGRTRKVMSWCLTRSVIVHCGTCNTPITNYQKIRKMTVNQMAEYMCIMARLGIKESLNNVGITDDKIEFPPLEKSIEVCKQILLQEVEE